jgi:hypothetical protein
VYELLIEGDGLNKAAHIGLIDVETLSKQGTQESGHVYGDNLAGETGHLTGGDETQSARVNGRGGMSLDTTWRPDWNAHQEAMENASVT